MNKEIKNQIIFALEDDNEAMSSALDYDSDLDEENKRLNRRLIEKHRKILIKIDNKKQLTKKDLRLIKDTNEIDLNDTMNIREHHEQAIKLNKWIKEKLK